MIRPAATKIPTNMAIPHARRLVLRASMEASSNCQYSCVEVVASAQISRLESLAWLGGVGFGALAAAGVGAGEGSVLAAGAGVDAGVVAGADACAGSKAASSLLTFFFGQELFLLGQELFLLGQEALAARGADKLCMMQRITKKILRISLQ